ncbi:type II secretion system F family protein [Actinotalea sp. Marseille-Q4924]|uniref:type II secretion system F family protein n=1 Tax=Actinotalea sp. Marseille-Q4924 TaxID=2866571 RepID=UPI001CE4B613|nr:type II secretion system F family protein [Actinotalea sp. Marseille-Q4924]
MTALVQLVDTSPALVGGLLGALAALGGCLVVARVRARTPTLDQRLAPYLRRRPSGSRLLEQAPARSPFPVLARLLAPLMQDAVRLVERHGSSTGDLQRRLVRAGRRQTVEELRAEQVVLAVVGAAAGLAAAIVLAAARGTSAVAGVVLVVAAAAAGLVVSDQRLAQQARRRERVLMAELPTVAELLALAVAAGEGALGALDRVSRTARGELSAEIAVVVADVRAGGSLTAALDALADRTGLVPLARFSEAIAVAVDRGTPLADVLRAQAQDVREAGRRELMEAGGRKEVAMLVPVVFLVLPVTVLFAVFPRLIALRLDL